MLIFLAILLIPAHLLPSQPITLSRTDLVSISNDAICLFELNAPTNTQQHFLAARAQKEVRYQDTR